jgi:hypothetical protein
MCSPSDFGYNDPLTSGVRLVWFSHVFSSLTKSRFNHSRLPQPLPSCCMCICVCASMVVSYIGDWRCLLVCSNASNIAKQMPYPNGIPQTVQWMVTVLGHLPTLLVRISHNPSRCNPPIHPKKTTSLIWGWICTRKVQIFQMRKIINRKLPLPYKHIWIT